MRPSLKRLRGRLTGTLETFSTRSSQPTPNSRESRSEATKKAPCGEHWGFNRAGSPLAVKETVKQADPGRSQASHTKCGASRRIGSMTVPDLVFVGYVDRY